MKRILYIILVLGALALYFFFPDQKTYYLNDEILEPSFLQGILISLCIIILLMVFFVWFDTEEKWWARIWNSLHVSSYVIILGWVWLMPIVQNSILWMNRADSSAQKIETVEVRVLGSIRMPQFKDDDGEQLLFWMRHKFEYLNNEIIRDGDSLSVQLEKGVFGYYYINHDKTKIIASQAP
jgi:hypothetical protein